jgi:hypothetical protein
VTGKQFLVAIDINHRPLRCFVQYKEVGETNVVIWTTDSRKAKWFDADEAEVEAALLSTLCPDYRVEIRQVSAANLWKLGH